MSKTKSILFFKKSFGSLLMSIFILLAFLHEAHTQEIWEQTSGPEGGSFRALKVNSSGYIFAGSPGGVSVSIDGGTIWSQTGLTSANIYDIEIDDNIGYIYAVTNGKGFYRSGDGGTTWDQVYNSNGLTSVFLYDMAIASDGDIYIASYGSGIFKSEDYGYNWTQINEGLTNTSLYSIAINPGNGYIFAGGYSGTGGGIFRSIDGTTWTKPDTALDGYAVQTIAFNASGSYIYAGAYNQGVFRSNDNGISWTQSSLPNNSVSSIVVNSSGTVYAGSIHTGGAYRSTDSGQTWTTINNGLAQLEVFSLAISPTTGYIFAGMWGAGICRSTDGGNNWSVYNSGLRNSSVYALSVNSADDIFAGAWGMGAMRSQNHGDNWNQINNGFTSENIRCFAIDNTQILAGTQGDGVFRSINNGDTWNHLNDGSLGSTLIYSLLIHPSNGDIFAGTSYGGLYRSSNNGGTWSLVGLNGLFVTAIVIDSSNNIYASTRGGSGIYRSVADGDVGSWNAYNNGLTSILIVSLAINPVNGHIFAGADGNGAFRSTDGGANWSQINNGLTSQWVSYNGLVINNKGHIFAGTSSGVYSSKNNGDSWQLMNAGLSQYEIESLVLDSAGVLIAGTNGGGVFRTVVSTTAAPFFDIAAGLTQVRFSQAAWGDYDNDGDLDIYLSGQGASNATIYRNDAGTFTDINLGVVVLNNGEARWGDYDNDNDLDLLITGYSNPTHYTMILRNDGGDTFTDIGAGLQPIQSGTTDWGDFDNDGDLDILLAGYLPGGSIEAAMIYRNDNGVFTDINAGLAGSTSGCGRWGDYDNDGDLDIFLSGHTGSGNSAFIYRNDNGSFVNINAGLTGVYNSSKADWGDYDNDGDLDIVYTGSTGGSNYISKVYRNDSGSFVDIIAGLTGVYYGSYVEWGDYDNDGDLDILLMGATSSTSPFGTITKIYNNRNDGTFEEFDSGLPGAFVGVAAWGDYDNDGRLDILLTGDEGPSSYIAKIYKNRGGFPVNMPPSTPAGLNTSISGNSVTFNWSFPIDDFTGSSTLTFNLRVGTIPGGSEIVSSMSDLVSGFRKIPGPGNVNHSNFWTINDLPDGDFFWSVQAVDGGFAGSAFAAEQSFDIQFNRAQDSLALVALYNSTNGINWQNITNPWLSGSIDTWEGVTVSGGRVTSINLYAKSLSGPIPTEIGDLSNLEYLNLSVNSLTGSIPSELCNLTNLMDLYLWNAQLTGEIPANINNLINLNDLSLSYNSLSGNIPPQIGSLDNLLSLALDGNNLTGAIPDEIGNMSSLALLHLEDNNLDGQIPASLGNVTTLMNVYLNDNNFSGIVPSEIASLTSLQNLDLRANQLVDLPVLTPLTNLTSTDISDNQFTFEDIEPNISIPGTFTYSPQSDIGVEKDTTLNPGESLTLTIPPIGGSALTYMWYKDGNGIPGATGVTHLIPSMTASDVGSYTCQIQSANVPGLTISSRPVHVNLVGAPTAYTDPPTSISSNGATFQGRVNPNDIETTVEFEWGFDALYGNTVTADESPVNGNTEVSVSYSTATLASSTTYHYRVVASNSSGTSLGADQIFTTLAAGQAPSAWTDNPGNIDVTTAQIYGGINPNGYSTDAYFEYGYDMGYGNVIYPDEGSNFSGSNDIQLSAEIKGLDPETTYYYRMVATNGLGTTYGGDFTFTTATYPDQVYIDHFIDFGDRANRSDYHYSDYKIIGLPGNIDIPINDLLPGDHNVDWQVFWDNGDDRNDPDIYLHEFDWSDIFRFQPGRAFWMLYKGSTNLSPGGTINSVSLYEGGYNIPLHPGWNLISNPFGEPVDWHEVLNANNISSDQHRPLWRYNSGFQQEWTLHPFDGYLYDNYNNQHGGDIKIPYIPTNGMGKLNVSLTQTESTEWQSSIILRCGDIIDASSIFGVSDKAGVGIDYYDYRKPRSLGRQVSLNIVNRQANGDPIVLGRDIRNKIEDYEVWDFEVYSTSNKEIILSFIDIDQIPVEYDVYLIDKDRSRYEDLSESTEYNFKPVKRVSEFRVIVGEQESVQEELEKILPKDYGLKQNYPNPFNPVTNIPVDLKNESYITVKVYNILGQEMRTLFEGRKGIGKHYFQWNGTNQSGKKMSSGIYIYQLNVKDEGSYTKKMILLK